MARRLNPFSKRRSTHRFSDVMAASQVNRPGDSPAEQKQMHTDLDAWQKKILTYAGLVPEVMTGYSFVHNVIDRVTFEIETFDRTKNEWVSDESPEIQGIERRINNTFRAGRAAALMHLIEECFVLVKRTDDLAFEFETLAATEIRYKNNRNEKRILNDGTKEDWVHVGEGVTVIRIYTPDPANRMLAGGPHKGLVGLLETMVLEGYRDQAAAVSVLAGNGIMFIPNEILPDDDFDEGTTDTPGSRTHFERRFQEAMTAPITNRSLAEAVVPITLFGPAEFAKDIVHIKPNLEDSAYENAKRMTSMIERYARDIDLPAQVILGLGDTNHWTDWKVDENTWAYHLEPRVQRIADALYTDLVAGIIENTGRDRSAYRLVGNPAKAIAQQDKSGTATDAYKLGALKPESYMEALGFDVQDMRVDAEETLLEIVASGAAFGDNAQSPSQPDRLAAGKNPLTVMRGASNIANQQQAALTKFYRRMLRKVGQDAALASRKYKREQKRGDKKAASDPVKFDGYEPGVYFERYREVIETGTSDQLFTLLRRIATLVGLDYTVLRTIWANEFEHRAKAVIVQAEIDAQKIERASWSSGKPAQVPEAAVRTLTSTANGGSNQGNGKAGNTNRPTHAGADPALREPLQETVGTFATEYTWHHDEPRVPFPPHVALDGRSWFTWEEFDALNHGGDNFPAGDTYFPGDHDGCRCEYSIEFKPVPDEGAGVPAVKTPVQPTLQGAATP